MAFGGKVNAYYCSRYFFPKTLQNYCIVQKGLYGEDCMESYSWVCPSNAVTPWLSYNGLNYNTKISL